MNWKWKSVGKTVCATFTVMRPSNCWRLEQLRQLLSCIFEEAILYNEDFLHQKLICSKSHTHKHACNCIYSNTVSNSRQVASEVQVGRLTTCIITHIFVQIFSWFSNKFLWLWSPDFLFYLPLWMHFLEVLASCAWGLGAHFNNVIASRLRWRYWQKKALQLLYASGLRDCFIPNLETTMVVVSFWALKSSHWLGHSQTPKCNGIARKWRKLWGPNKS